MTPSTEDFEDFRLLGLANENGKFAIELGYPMEEDMNAAFERGINNEWFRFVYLAALAHVPDRAMRVFKLTRAGVDRKRAAQRAIEERTKTTPPTREEDER
jgi:hypothetical protein